MSIAQNFYGFPQGVFPISDFNKYFPSITVFVVGTNGNYKTIQAALNAAHAAGGGEVFVQKGTYTENLILYDNTSVTGSIGTGDLGAISLIGTHTPPISGKFIFKDINLSAANAIFSSTAAGTSIVGVVHASIGVNDGFVFDLPNWTSPGGFEAAQTDCFESVNDGFVNNTGGASLFIQDSYVGAGSTHVMTLSGSIYNINTSVVVPVNFASGATGIVDQLTSYSGLGGFTFSGNSSITLTNTYITSGSSPAITMSSSAEINISNCTFSSSSNPCISGSGAGVLNLSGITFTDNASISGSLTLGSSSANLFGEVRANSDIGGSAGSTAITSTSSSTISSGVGSVRMSNANPGTNSAWIKIYIGTTPYWIPAWSTNAP